ALLGSNQVAALDLFDPRAPRIVGRSSLPIAQLPYTSETQGDRIIMPVAEDHEGVWIDWPDARGRTCGWVACTLPHDSGLTVYDATTRRALGQLTLRAGALNLSATRPIGLAFSVDRGLLAVA